MGCPNGEIYYVGDNYNSCGSLACVNGKSGRCHRHHGKWSRRKVTCGSLPKSNEQVKNTVEENAHRVGGWGGKCTCPNGEIYYVGDNYNSCGSLACVNGKSGRCHRHHGKWSRRK